MLRQFVLLITILLFSSAAQAESKTLLNVSYDPTRELYEAYNSIFTKYWQQKTGEEVTIQQSHGGSGKQARSVIDGLAADVVTLALAYDIGMIAERSALIPSDWQTKLPSHSIPYHSVVVFLVREGNPKHIKDWDDLVRDDVQVITPNPKVSGGARWNYLAAYGYALKKFQQDDAKAFDFVKTLFSHVPVLDTGARGSTTTFMQRGIGDVLVTWENEAFLAMKSSGEKKFEMVMPSLTIRAEPPVAVVEKNAEKHGNAALAKAYLEYLYSKDAQHLIAQNFFRPNDSDVAAEFAKQFPEVPSVTIDDFGGWKLAQEKHFADDGLFDKMTVH